MITDLLEVISAFITFFFSHNDMPRTLSAALVFGAEISNSKGKKIGQIEDLLVDLKSGHVIYAIVSFIEEVGTEDNYFPIPTKAIKENSDEDKIKLNIPKEMLKDAPSFEKKNWPKEYNKDFVQSVYEHYGYEVPIP